MLSFSAEEKHMLKCISNMTSHIVTKYIMKIDKEPAVQIFHIHYLNIDGYLAWGIGEKTENEDMRKYVISEQNEFYL